MIDQKTTQSTMSARIVSVCGVPVPGDVRIYPCDRLTVTVDVERNTARSIVILPPFGEWNVIKVEE